MARTTNAKKQPEAHKIDGAEIFAALKELEKSQGIPMDYMMERLKQALTNAYRKDREDHRDVPAENVVVDITDCEAISRAVDPLLDEADPIAESYHFEVCSAGLERALKRPSDFERFMGSNVTVKLYRPRNGLKEIPCVLTGYEDGKITVEAGKETITFEKSQVALVRLRVEF